MCKSDGEQVLNGYRVYIAQEKEWMEKLRKAHNDNPYTVEDKLVENSKVCFIFSCPGREELIHNELCYGKTGNTLNILLEMLKEEDSTIFPSDLKSGYNIANASSIVHFEALDNLPEAEDDEILEDSNLKKINDFLEGIKGLTHVILFGKKAQLLEDKIKHKANLKIIVSRHVGFKSLNHIAEDVHGDKINKENYKTAEERTKARIEVVAKEIIDQIK